MKVPANSGLTSNPATTSRPYCDNPESCMSAAPKLPTPKMNALCIDVNPRNSSSTATNEFIS